jgi:hypothetical protein
MQPLYKFGRSIRKEESLQCEAKQGQARLGETNDAMCVLFAKLQALVATHSNIQLCAAAMAPKARAAGVATRKNCRSMLVATLCTRTCLTAMRSRRTLVCDMKRDLATQLDLFCELTQWWEEVATAMTSGTATHPYIDNDRLALRAVILDQIRTDRTVSDACINGLSDDLHEHMLARGPDEENTLPYEHVSVEDYRLLALQVESLLKLRSKQSTKVRRCRERLKCAEGALKRWTTTLITTLQKAKAKKQNSQAQRVGESA